MRLHGHFYRTFYQIIKFDQKVFEKKYLTPGGTRSKPHLHGHKKTPNLVSNILFDTKKEIWYLTCPCKRIAIFFFGIKFDNLGI